MNIFLKGELALRSSHALFEEKWLLDGRNSSSEGLGSEDGVRREGSSRSQRGPLLLLRKGKVLQNDDRSLHDPFVLVRPDSDLLHHYL